MKKKKFIFFTVLIIFIISIIAVSLYYLVIKSTETIIKDKIPELELSNKELVYGEILNFEIVNLPTSKEKIKLRCSLISEGKTILINSKNIFLSSEGEIKEKLVLPEELISGEYTLKVLILIENKSYSTSSNFKIVEINQPNLTKEETPCTEECSTNGVKQCAENGYQICENYDSDSCLEWSNVLSCPSGQSCSGGICLSLANCTNNVQYKCYDGDIYWYDSCNRLVNKKEECKYGCGSDECLFKEWQDLDNIEMYSHKCDYNTSLNLEFIDVQLGQTYNLWEGSSIFTQVTVEYLPDQQKGKLIIIYTDTKGYDTEYEIYKGHITPNNPSWWGQGLQLYSVSDRGINPCQFFEIPESGEYSIVYITRPNEDSLPKNLVIKKVIKTETPRYPLNYSGKVVIDFASFPDKFFDYIKDPYAFNNDMNRVYDSMKDLMGEDSPELKDGHIFIQVKNMWAYGLAGNPILINPYKIDINRLNLGHPGDTPVHELGHDFTRSKSYCWGGDWDYANSPTEMWANFLMTYVYMERIVPGYDIEYPNDPIPIKEYWEDQMNTTKFNSPIHYFLGFILKLKEKYKDDNWQILKTFFRKYQIDSAKEGTLTEQERLSVRYLAESVKEFTGSQTDYDYVVNYLAEKGFPKL